MDETTTFILLQTVFLGHLLGILGSQNYVDTVYLNIIDTYINMFT